jgi:hypothetical protein
MIAGTSVIAQSKIDYFARMELIDHYLTQKLFALIAILIGGIGFVITRKVLSTINRASSHMVISSIKKDPSKARDFAASLDIPYSKREVFLKIIIQG